ncbi:MAG: pentapeptide repeat-containing protein [Nostoc sp.]|uniref:pentapeptide repeat-containing protein n=1 Tax=Nostoc sp. TaxID=1180 RepID=UPI002FFAD1D2
MVLDFSSQNLRGRNFKGRKDLAGANFSNVDMQGTNFTNANLTGANFSYAKAGLQRRWAILLVLLSWLLSGTSGYLWAFNGRLVLFIFDSSGENDYIVGWTVLIILIAFFIITIRQGLSAGLGAFAFVAAVAFALAGGFAFGFAYTFAFAFAAAFVAAFVAAVAFALARSLAFPFAFAGAGVVGVGFPFALGFTFAVAFAVAGTLLSIYISWQAMKGDEKHSLIRNIVIAFAATGGTSFHGADLTGADFTQATLKSTDLRNTILICSCWHQAKMLDRIRPGSTYLQNSQVRQLLVTGQGQDKNFDRQNLRGINLKKANLADASFIGADLSEANLQDADLSRAKLKQTQLDCTDLTGATLTGATIEDWGITGETKLNEVKCDYIFMRLETKDNPNRCRKPDDWNKNFEKDEFTEYIAPIVKTLDLYHNTEVNFRAIQIALNQLIENNPEAKIQTVAVEKRGVNKNKLLIKAETATTANHSELNAEYFKSYDTFISLSPESLLELLKEKDNTISLLDKKIEIALKTAIEKHSVNTETYNNQENTMSQAPKYNLNNPKFGGGFSGDEGTTIGGTLNDYSSNIDYSSKQNLTEAAADIQQLLTQLQTQGYSQEKAQQQAAQDLAKKADNDPTVLGKLVKWGQSLSDTAAKTTVSEAAKEVFKIALRLSGIPIP